MIFETQEAVLVHEDDDLAFVIMGGIWGEFKDSIPAIQAKVLTEGFNLILLGNEPTNEIEDLMDPEGGIGGFTTSTLPTIITNVLVDETIHTADKKNLVFAHITGNIIEALVKMGFTLNDDEASEEHLASLNKLVEVFYDLQGYQDLIGLADVLVSMDIPPKERFLLVMERYLGEGFDLDIYERLIDDVSEVTLKAIHDALMQQDASEGIPECIKERVIKNKELLDHTLAYKHIRENGQLGGSIGGFLSFFGQELFDIMENEEVDITKRQIQYGLEVTAFFLVSEINDHALRNDLILYLSENITDHVAMVKIEKKLKELVLTYE